MDHLGWGLEITVLGMGLVFGLLALLWALLTVLLRLDRPEAAGPAGAAAAPGAPEPWSGDALYPALDSAFDPGLDPALVTAITLAVLTHGALQRKEAAPEARAHWPGSLLHASRWVASGRLRQNRTFRKGRW